MRLAGLFFSGIILLAVATAIASADDAILPGQGDRVDTRNIVTGQKIPDEGYCDQPYVVVTNDGNWLCTLTTGPGHEGQGGQHVVSTISADRGRTWSALVDIEPSSGPEASWVVPFAAPSGRVYAFYTYNGDRIDTLRGKKIRADMLGWYAFRYSDDNGRSWSDERYRLPMRVTACDRGNDWNGEVIIFWGISKPFAFRGNVYFAFTKLGRYMLDQGEGWLFRSDNLLTESDVDKLHWTMLPEGEHGIRNDAFGSVQEEHNLVPLADGSLYMVYRTTTGYPCHTYSRDGGRTWDKPQHMTYSPGGRKIKNPRACPKVWRTSEGKYLFWFHNHSGRSFRDRNPAWIVGGIERDGHIYWSQPEILLYDDNPNVRMSYPDLIEQDGQYWVTETQKSIARIHALDKSQLEGLWLQGERREIARGALLLDLEQDAAAGDARLPKRLDLKRSGGLTVECWLRFDDLEPGQVVLDARDGSDAGFQLSLQQDGALQIELSDGTTQASWNTDADLLQPGKLHHVVAIVDNGPRIITWVVDGQLCDGGQQRQFGWGRYDAELGQIGDGEALRIAPRMRGTVQRIRIYDRRLRTSEAVANFHAGA
jgi:hypothetical protein